MENGNFITLISAILVGGGTIALAIMTWRSIRQTRSIREEDRELDSKKRRLEEVQRWINEVASIKAECAKPTGSPEEWRQRGARARIAAANKEYIKIEAERLDSEFVTDVKLVTNVEELSTMLEKEVTSLNAPNHQKKIEGLCTKSLTKISSIKAELRL
jgi:hypothetical protein